VETPSQLPKILNMKLQDNSRTIYLDTDHRELKAKILLFVAVLFVIEKSRQKQMSYHGEQLNNWVAVTSQQSKRVNC
jgi:hypothetical protein